MDNDQVKLNTLESPLNNKPEIVPLHTLQLAEVVLVKLDVNRISTTIDLATKGVPNIAWDVGYFLPEEEGQSLAARIELNYAFPDSQSPDYTMHVELVGIFSPIDFVGDADASEGDQSPETHKVPFRERVIPLQLNNYTVMTLLWPYMRELVHQVQLRMRVPLVLLPTLNATPLQVGAETAGRAKP